MQEIHFYDGTVFKVFSSHSVLDVVEELFEDDFDDVSRKKLNPAHLLGEIFKKIF